MIHQERKAKIIEVMTKYLNSQGWPNVPNANHFVMQQLPNLWNELSKAGLLLPTWNYQQFAQVATNEYVNATIRSDFDNMFRRR